jgi:Putative Ig domain
VGVLGLLTLLVCPSCCLQPSGEPLVVGPGADAGGGEDAGFGSDGGTVTDGGPEVGFDAGPLVDGGWCGYGPLTIVLPGPDDAGSYFAIATAKVDEPYAYQLVAQGGCSPYDWSPIPGEGVLPPGLSLVASGLLSGVPAQPGSFALLGEVTDMVGSTANQGYLLTILPR